MRNQEQIASRASSEKRKGDCGVTRYTQRIYHEKLLDLLGNKCVKCGFIDSRALQIDHIHGGGHKELSKGNESMYRNYLKNPDLAKSELQVLCANCNQIKRAEQREDAWSSERKVCPECGSPSRHKKTCSKS
jgi:hypothetical protein